MADSFENVGDIILERASEGISKKYLQKLLTIKKKNVTEAKSSFGDVKDAKIRKNPQIVMITVECNEAILFFPVIT